MRPRNLLALSVALLFPLAALAVTLPQQTELDEALENLEAARASGKRLDDALEKLENELGSLQTETTSLAASIQKNEAALEEKETALTILTSERDRKIQDLAKQQTTFNSLVSTLLQMDRIPATTLMAQGQSLPEQLRTASLSESVTQSVTREAETLRQQTVELNKLADSVKTAQGVLQEKQRTLLEQRQNLTARLEARQRAYNATQSRQKSVNTRIATLARESRSLQALLAKLEQERALFETIGLPRSKPRNGLSGDVKRASVKPPASGAIIAEYGDKKDDDETYRGVVIRTAAGATVTAPEAGEIVFNGPFMDYGTMVLIRHDATYHMLIAGLTKVHTSLGQQVIAGEPIGTMGNDPQSGRDLYVELRKNGKAIDPMLWMGNLQQALAKPTKG